ncbi:unnamed protein product [Thelazia callipaeda]|uniref:GLOBIN domain-containing protein n=1 Tax=Thelazia callipaeda TaxID=103827 RepID=A0A0N5D753_THECL|nr:unnamed protein product [Thelazia callipaeda]
MFCFRCFCSKTTSVDSTNFTLTEMSSKTSTGKDEKINSRIPLNTRQKYLITKNWKGISRVVTTAGVEMFMKMFSVHPEYYELFAFRSIAKSNLEKQRTDECLKAHSEAVMNFLGQAIRLIIPLIKAMEEPFLYAVKLILDERYTDNMDLIYKTTIKVILRELEDGCRKEIFEMNGKNEKQEICEK